MMALYLEIMRKNFGLLMGLYAISAMERAQEHQEFIKEINKPITKKIKKEIGFSKEIEEVKPKGVKEYFFTDSGHFFNSMPTGSYSIFYKCFALNDKNAKRKFDAYRKRHRGQ